MSSQTESVQVIQHGNRKQGSCEKCGCIFIAQANQIKRRVCSGPVPGILGKIFIDPPKQLWTENYIPCPECGTDVVLSMEGVPDPY